MHLSPFFPFLANIFQSSKQGRESETGKAVLRNYPHCGELGREENKECFWDCEWQPIPDDVLQNYGPFVTTQYVRSTECFRDCYSVQQCLKVAQPIYDELKQTGETNFTVILETLYSPYFRCLNAASTSLDGNFYATSSLVYDNCFVHLLRPLPSATEFPCIDKFLVGFEPFVNITNREGSEEGSFSTKRQDFSTLFQTILKNTRLSGFASGFRRKNLNATLHQYPWLCSLKTR
jgi:hypothetical protein